MQRNQTTAAALLCGGISRRLGFPKEMLRVDGLPLAALLAQRLRQIFPTVITLSNAPERLRHVLDTPIHPDEYRLAGPLAGIHAGLKHAGETIERCFFLACDMPLVHNGIIQELLDRADRTDAPTVLASVGGRIQPVCAIYSTRLLPEIEKRLQNGYSKSIMGLIDRFPTEIVEFGPDQAPFFRDIDTPEDIEILRDAYDHVEPLPITRSPSGGLLPAKWTVDIRLDNRILSTPLCLPTALRELAAGTARAHGHIRNAHDIDRLDIDYSTRRIHIHSNPRTTPPVPHATLFHLPPPQLRQGFDAMRELAVVSNRTGRLTSQALFTDAHRVRLFFEDLTPTNALLKIIGAALLEEIDLSQGALLVSSTDADAARLARENNLTLHVKESNA